MQRIVTTNLAPSPGVMEIGSKAFGVLLLYRDSSFSSSFDISRPVATQWISLPHKVHVLISSSVSPTYVISSFTTVQCLLHGTRLFPDVLCSLSFGISRLLLHLLLVQMYSSVTPAFVISAFTSISCTDSAPLFCEPGFRMLNIF